MTVTAELDYGAPHAGVTRATRHATYSAWGLIHKDPIDTFDQAEPKGEAVVDASKLKLPKPTMYLQ